MSDENPFRFALLGVALIQASVSLVYLKKSGAASTVFRRCDEPKHITAPLSLAYLGYCASTVAYLVNPDWMAWSAVAISPAIRWIGLVVLVLSAGITLWSLHALGANLTFVPATKENHALVTSGPYRWMRHPLYTALIVQVVGVGLLTANWLVALSGTLTWTILVVRTRREEANLIDTFGDEYRHYMQRVGRFLPRPPHRSRSSKA